MDQSKIERINELARKAKGEGLTDGEKIEQQALRREYIDAMKASLISQLDNVVMVDEAGNEQRLVKKEDGCCNHSHHHHNGHCCDDPNCNC
ncbi:MAG: DUF896 domain-containing protein [Peptococcaceae bacterium]|nr:DUF896 domain-containing protein [Peptococcaceae bacterium]